MSSSRGAKPDMTVTSHLKSTLQELKRSVVDGADRLTRDNSFKSTAQPLKEEKTDSTVKKGGEKSKGAIGLNKQ